MRSCFPDHRSIRRAVAGLAVALGLLAVPARAQDGDALIVRVQVPPGPYLVGQGIELSVGVDARDQRPTLELPVPRDAQLWVVGTSFRPISVAAIGKMVAGENRFLTWLRLVARTPGVLELPPVVARLGEREGKSVPARLKFENPPMAGRTSDFLGGIGEFTAEAEAEVGQVRVGQEFLYRIRVAGPAAWGMTMRPDLARLKALPIAARVETLPDEAIDEPPSRAFVYRVRPSKPGEVVLPPVTIASYDPRVKRYLTRATRGVPLKVVAVPSFDASKLDYKPAEPGWLERVVVAAARLAAAAGLVAFAVVAGRRLRRRWIESPRTGRGPARRFARAAASGLVDRPGESPAEAARRVVDALIEYARRGVDRPSGALTPEEARAAVARASGVAELGLGAARLAARCDRILFAEEGEGRAVGPEEAASLSRDARDLFAALGRSGGWRSPSSVSGPTR
jgi:hypothetical protein